MLMVALGLYLRYMEVIERRFTPRLRSDVVTVSRSVEDVVEEHGMSATHITESENAWLINHVSTAD